MNEINTSRNSNSRLVGKTSQVSDSRQIDQEAIQFAQLMKASSSSASNHCKFKETDKLLVVSIDDLDSHPQKMKQLTDYLRTSGIPATLFPHSKANPEVLNTMSQLPNTQLGWHGTALGKLDKPSQAGVDKTVIAWSYGVDAEGKKAEIKGNSNIVARGVLCDREKKFDQHEISSCTIGNDPRPEIQKQNEIQLRTQRQEILNNGGVLSVHMHNSDNLHLLRETVEEFERKGGRVIHLDQLKGCGKT